MKQTFEADRAHTAYEWCFLPILPRVKFDQWMRALDKNHVMPEVEEGETIFEYYVNLSTFEWEK